MLDYFIAGKKRLIARAKTFRGFAHFLRMGISLALEFVIAKSKTKSNMVKCLWKKFNTGKLINLNKIIIQFKVIILLSIKQFSLLIIPILSLKMNIMSLFRKTPSKSALFSRIIGQ